MEPSSPGFPAPQTIVTPNGGTRPLGSPVRVAFVGAGGIAGYHLANLARIPEAEVVAICDLVPEAAARAADFLERQRQVRPAEFSSYQKMLDEQEMDAVYICVPPFAHDGVEILSARRKVNLFVEKPVAIDLPTAVEILAEIRQSGIMAASGYLLRYWASTQAARLFLTNKPISLVACDRWSGIPGGPDFWWRDMSKSGGQLHEGTTHQVDLMRYLAGEIVRVDARHSYGTLVDLERVTVPDTQIALLEFASGAIGYVSNSCVLTRGGHASRLEFVLRDMVVRWGETLTVDPPNGVELPDQPEYSMNIDEAFIRAVGENQPELIRSPYEEAVRTLAVTVAARESAERGKAVEVSQVQ